MGGGEGWGAGGAESGRFLGNRRGRKFFSTISFFVLIFKSTEAPPPPTFLSRSVMNESLRVDFNYGSVELGLGHALNWNETHFPPQWGIVEKERMEGGREKDMKGETG